MKRSNELLNLSREHHGALVLALRIARAADAATIAALMASVPALFRAELDPHFRAEENELLPRLRAAGEDALVERTLDDHRDLRQLVAAIAAGDGGSLKAFGVALAAHVRFEERELFAAAELLPAAGPVFLPPQPAAFSPATTTGVMP